MQSRFLLRNTACASFNTSFTTRRWINETKTHVVIENLRKHLVSGRSHLVITTRQVGFLIEMLSPRKRPERFFALSEEHRSSTYKHMHT